MGRKITHGRYSHAYKTEKSRCIHGLPQDHQTPDGKRWRCTYCGRIAAWNESWTYFGFIECRKCGCAAVDAVACSERCFNFLVQQAENETMPLFECETCHCIENTALSNFWQNQMQEHEEGKVKPRQCSECDPSIGKWHGRFDKISVADYRAKFPESPIKYLARAPQRE